MKSPYFLQKCGQSLLRTDPLKAREQMSEGAESLPGRKQAQRIISGFKFEDGAVIDLRISYWTAGELNREGSNALLLSHGASGNRDWAIPFCRTGGAFDPTDHFVISVDLPGGGDSSRLSRDAGFPERYTLRDLTNALEAFLEAIGAKRNVLFCGVSVSTLIGFDLAAKRSDLMGGAVLWNCAVRCDGYAQGAIEALVATLALDGGPAGMSAAVKAFYPSLTGRAMLAESSPATRAQLTDHIASGWIARWTAPEIVARYVGTITGDVTALHGGEPILAKKLTNPMLLLPSSSDHLLPAASVEAFAKNVPAINVAVCQSDRGHQSTSAPADSPEFKFYDTHTSAFFAGLKT